MEHMEQTKEQKAEETRAFEDFRVRWANGNFDGSKAVGA